MGCNCGKSSFNTSSVQPLGGTPASAPAVVGVPVAPPAPVQTQAPLSGIQAPQLAGNAFVR